MTTESLTDMEVILDFLEEHYDETDGADECQKFEEIFMTREQPVNDTYEQYCSHWEFNRDIKQEIVMTSEMPVNDIYEQQYCSQWEFNPRLDDATEAFSPHSDTVSPFGPVPSSVHARQPSKPHTKTAGRVGGGGGKLRLFRFLFEVLEDPGMAHCVSWVPTASGDGVFRFSSRNKEQVAALWGQRKGNKRPMTYQKMSRALRNYTRTGEIFKVKKKLTYQFSPDTLRSLLSCHHRHL